MKEKLKIGILINTLNAYGGIGKIAIEEVKGLRKIGYDAYLLVLFGDEDNNAYKDLMVNIPTIYLAKRIPKLLCFSFKFPFFSFFSLYHITYSLFIPFLIKKKEFDLIVCHETYLFPTVFNIQIIRNIKYIAYIWDPVNYILRRVYNNSSLRFFFWFLLPIGKLFDIIMLKSSYFVITGGSAHLNFIKRFNDKVAVLPPAYDVAEKIEKSKENFILSVTAWKEGKNPEYLIELMKKLEYAKLIMAGMWIPLENKEEFEQKIKLAGLEKRIIVLGTVSENKLRELYLKATVFLQTNDDRGFGLPALEAAAHGCTFIIPEGQGVCELFKNGEEGFFVEEKDTENILKYLSTLLRDSNLASKMGTLAWNTVREKYSWENHARKLGEICENVILGRGIQE